MKVLFSTFIFAIFFSSCQRPPEEVIESLRMIGIEVETQGLNECSEGQFQLLSDDLDNPDGVALLQNYVRDNKISKIIFSNKREDTNNCDAAVFDEDDISDTVVCDPETIQNPVLPLADTIITKSQSTLQITTNSQIINKNIYVYNIDEVEEDDQLDSFMSEITETNDQNETYINMAKLDLQIIDFSTASRVASENFTKTNCGKTLPLSEILRALEVQK